MKWKGIIVGGIIAGIMLFVLGNLMYFIFGKVIMEVPAGFYKEMIMPQWMYEYLAASILIGIVFAVIYDKFNSALPLRGFSEGMEFGFLIGIFYGVGVALTNYLMHDLTVTYLLVNAATTVVEFSIAGGFLTLAYDWMKVSSKKK